MWASDACRQRQGELGQGNDHEVGHPRGPNRTHRWREWAARTDAAEETEGTIHPAHKVFDERIGDARDGEHCGDAYIW